MANEGEAAAETLPVPDPEAHDHVAYNPSVDDLRAAARHDETTTEFGSPAYVSEYRSRSAEHTKNARDHQFSAADHDAVLEALSAVAEGDAPMLCLDRRLGRHPEASYVCRLFVPESYARIALAWAKLLEPVESGSSGTAERTDDGTAADTAETTADPDFVTVQLPDREGPTIRVLPDEGVTAVLGSDYTGEAKKSFLRLFMLRAKEQGGLGLHAGSKRLRLVRGDPPARGADGSGGATAPVDEADLERVGQLFLGLSGTGKSTLTGHGYWLDDPECGEMLQDDVCALLPDGTVAGSEGRGLYIKTLGLDEARQPELYEAATDRDAVLENVDVDAGGRVDFDSRRHTANGRAVVQRDSLRSAADDIDLEGVDQVFFITRNPLTPPMAKLSADQAAVAFMLGESVETSAGDPARAGESIRVVGTNPFIVGSEGAEGNRFRDLVADLDVQCYLLNTGQVGVDDPADVGVRETVTLLREVARGRIEWTPDPDVGLQVPATVPGLDAAEFRVGDRTDDVSAAIASLRDERRAHLDQFDDLDPEIVDAVY